MSVWSGCKADTPGAVRRPGSEVWSVESYKGCVLADRERNFRDDSDFYAVVWSEEHQKVHTVEWGTTRFPMVGCGCTVDATDEVRAKASAYLGRLAVEDYKVNARREARLPTVGKLVQTVNTRKVPPGTRGVVFWTGEDRYGNGVRVGIELAVEEEGKGGHYSGDRLFFAERNLEVVAPDQYLENLEEEAERYAGGHEQWHQPFVHPGMVSM